MTFTERLRTQASAVYISDRPALSTRRLSARAVARRLWPYIYAASTRHSSSEMRMSCAFLANNAAEDWMMAAETALEVSLASTALAILSDSNEENVRAALAFWASENDPAEWRAVVH